MRSDERQTQRPVSHTAQLGHKDRSEQSGQATVEFALIIPLIVMVAMVIAQVVALAYLQLTLAHVSREVARELVVDPYADIGHLTDQYSTLGSEDLSIQTQIVLTEPNGRQVIVVRVTHNAVVISGAFRRFLADVTLRAEATMLVEP